jgi:hypothetical protein
MALKMVIAQELNVDFISFNEELYSIMYSKGDYFVIFRENATCSDSIGRWDMIFRHKDNLSQFLLKDDSAIPRLPSKDDFIEEQYLNGVKKMNTFFDQAGIMENDLIIGYAEVTPISKDTSQFILYLKEGIDESFAEPIFKVILNFIAPPRIITDKIDPKIGKQIKESPKKTRQKATKKKIESGDTKEIKEKTEDKPRFPIDEIKKYTIEDKRPYDDRMIYLWQKGWELSEISVRLPTPLKVGTIQNRLTYLRKQLGKDIVPYRIPPKKKLE